MGRKPKGQERDVRPLKESKEVMEICLNCAREDCPMGVCDKIRPYLGWNERNDSRGRPRMPKASDKTGYEFKVGDKIILLDEYGMITGIRNGMYHVAFYKHAAWVGVDAMGQAKRIQDRGLKILKGE